MRLPVYLLVVTLGLVAPAPAGAVLFDFDSAPLHASLPIDLTVDALTAHFSATGQGYSIQPANTMGFTPLGFSGYCLYPNSVYAADLLVDFSVPLTDFSIMYAPQELGCDTSALMRVTAYMDGAYVGTNTATADPPGTWPTGTLTFSSSQNFNRVVVHYDTPPACGDWGPIFMADNMIVTPAVPSAAGSGPDATAAALLVYPNPAGSGATVRFNLARSGPALATVHDVEGRAVRTLFRGALGAGFHSIPWDGRDNRGVEVPAGIYMCRVEAGAHSMSTRVVVLRAR